MREDEQRDEERLEMFKQALIQAYPHMYEDIYGQKDPNAIPEEYEQRIPQSIEEFMEIEQVLSQLGQGNASELPAHSLDIGFIDNG